MKVAEKEGKMNYARLGKKKIAACKHIVTMISLIILLSSIFLMQGCANRVNYRDLRFDSMQISRAVGIGRSGFDQPNVIFSKLDFIPLDRNDYKLKWMGNAITYMNCYHFKPIIELEEPAPKTFTREFDIVKERWWLIADEMIGGFSVTFNEGSTVPDEIKYDASLNSFSKVPPGTPDPIYGKFWMGCTVKRKIKANADKDGENGNFYITLAPIMIPADGVTIGGVGRSPKHYVSCETIPSGSSPPDCSETDQCRNRRDCPIGDCVSGPGIGHYECLRCRCVCLPD